MKHLTIILTLMLAVAAGSTPAAAATAPPFLTALGIAVPPELVITDQAADNNDIELIDLDQRARRALLDGVVDVYYDYNEDGSIDEIIGIDTSIWIEGVKPLPGDLSLVLFRFEYGDGGCSTIGIYNSAGQRLDYLDNGPHSSTEYYDIDEAHTHTSISHITKLIFTADTRFELTATMTQKRSFTAPDGSINEWGQPNYVTTSEVVDWELTKIYHYAIGKDGHITLKQISGPERKGDVPDRFLKRDAINDIYYYPANDAERVKKLDLVIQQPQYYNADDSDEWHYHFRDATMQVYLNNPSIFLEYIIANPTSLKLIDMLFEAVGDSLLPKEKLLDDIGRLPDAKHRQYLEKMTSQWGPKDAVG